MKKLMLVAIAAIFSLSATMVMAQPPQGERKKMPTTEERVEMMKKQLDLSDEQYEQIFELESKREMPKRGDREAMKKMAEEQSAQMEEILTEKQFKKWKRLQNNRPQQG